jgi:hypothetical protein
MIRVLVLAFVLRSLEKHDLFSGELHQNIKLSCWNLEHFRVARAFFSRGELERELESERLVEVFSAMPHVAVVEDGILDFPGAPLTLVHLLLVRVL